MSIYRCDNCSAVDTLRIVTKYVRQTKTWQDAGLCRDCYMTQVVEPNLGDALAKLADEVTPQ